MYNQPGYTQPDQPPPPYSASQYPNQQQQGQGAQNSTTYTYGTAPHDNAACLEDDGANLMSSNFGEKSVRAGKYHNMASLCSRTRRGFRPQTWSNVQVKLKPDYWPLGLPPGCPIPKNGSNRCTESVYRGARGAPGSSRVATVITIMMVVSLRNQGLHESCLQLFAIKM